MLWPSRACHTHRVHVHIVGRALCLPCSSSTVIDRRYSLIRAAQLFLELRFALVERLQTKLPAVQLDAVLIDIAGDLGPLRLVFF